MQNTVPAGAKTGTLRKLKAVGLVLLVLLAAAAMLGLPALGNSLPDNTAGRYSRIVVDASAPEAAAVDFNLVRAVKGNGPGIRNWHCVDYGRSPDWWGPWRVLKGSAEADCLDYIAHGQD